MEIASLDAETVAAVIAAAHAEGLAAVVHVSTLERALEAMAFGADGLVHVWRDEVVSEVDARRFAEADIFVVPTLSVIVSADDSIVAELVQETDEALLSPIQQQTLADRFAGGLAEGGEVAMENVRRLRAAGVRLVAGTDAPNPGTAAGISMHGELRLLSRAGLGSAEALAAATSVAADAFGVADRGRIAEGHLADLCWCAATSRKTCRAATISSRSGRMGTWWSAPAAPQGPRLRPGLRPPPRKRWSLTSRTASRRDSAHGT